MERPNLRLPLPVKVGINTGACLDIPTGEWIRGTHDQMILNGGIGFITGIVGPGNCGKTTLMRFFKLTAIARCIQTVPDLFDSSYDTEVNTHEGRNEKLSFSIEVFRERSAMLEGNSIIDEGIWQITDKSVYSGNEFFEEMKNYLKAKRDDKRGKRYDTCFLSRDGVTPMKTMTPSFNDIDSLSHFVTSDVEKIMNDTELGESAGNTMFMRQGLAKSRMLMELPSLSAGGFQYFLFTAHIGKEIVMPAGPGTPPPRKQLQHMPGGEVIKGVTNNFFYLLHNCWMVTSSRPFLNQSTKAPEYPFEPGDEVQGDLDLMIMTLKQLRGKNGESGFNVEVLTSQREGVLPSLTEFHYIKRMDRFGLEGNDRDYALSLCPDVRLSRTKVRKICREDKRVQRALEITSQLCQMYEFQPFLKDKLMKPDELRKALEEKGYDWEMILTQTRGWNTFNDEEHPGYLWTTMDLCRAARGEYHPYWLEKDCKTLVPKYVKMKKDAAERYSGPAAVKELMDKINKRKAELYG